MSDRPVTLIVSDLHMGGGTADPGDDFVYHGAPFERFVSAQLQTAEGRAGRTELILNGDTFELAQVRADVYTLGSATYWCSEQESLLKLEYVIEGHADVFDALREFAAAGNVVTLGAGNHDVELYWPEVRERLRQRIGDIQFELGAEWYSRHAGRLAIAHGHMVDPANRFQHWSRPLLPHPSGIERLEMCPGTLFMVKFVNELEKKYPFLDNLRPVTSLVDILAKDALGGFGLVAWMLSRFATRHPSAILRLDSAEAMNPGSALKGALMHDPRRLALFSAAYRQVVDPTKTAGDLQHQISDEHGLVTCLLDLFAALPFEEWLCLTALPPTTLGLELASGDPGTLAIAAAGRQLADEVLRESARLRLAAGASVVVMGHTHQPDVWKHAHGEYFNPGSWTRYVNSAQIGLLTLDDLVTEQNFPYQLNYVRVDVVASGDIGATMVCFEEHTGFRYGQRLNL